MSSLKNGDHSICQTTKIPKNQAIMAKNNIESNAVLFRQISLSDCINTILGLKYTHLFLCINKIEI